MGTRTTGIAALLAGGLLLTGCATAAPSEPAAVATSEPAAEPTSTAIECAPASAAALAAVNASIAAEPGYQQPGVEPYPQALSELTTTRYEPLDIWTLGGVMAAGGSEGGFLVIWATREDPTAEDFAGELFSFAGSSSEGESAAPVLEPGYVGEHDMDVVPGPGVVCTDRLGG